MCIHGQRRAEIGVQTGSHDGSTGESKVHAQRGQGGTIACASCVLKGQDTVPRQRTVLALVFYTMTLRLTTGLLENHDLTKNAIRFLPVEMIIFNSPILQVRKLRQRDVKSSFMIT